MNAKRAFTLIELLAVIVIIGILAGFTMKLMSIVNRRMAYARANTTIEKIKHALAEFHAAYGIYPPVSAQRSVVLYLKGKNDKPPDGGYGLKDGMASFLFNDPQSDRWKHFVEDIKSATLTNCAGHNAGNNLLWTNSIVWFEDPWGNDFVYTCTDPFQNYTLVSPGPDGNLNTEDDVGNIQLR